MTTLTEGDADRTVTVAPGDEIVITLAENRTAGFQWVVEATTGELTVRSSDFDASAAASPGTAGRRTIVLHAGGPGTGELRLRYQRSFASDTASARPCRFRFLIKPA